MRAKQPESTHRLGLQSNSPAGSSAKEGCEASVVNQENVGFHWQGMLPIHL